jgi:hypothetical protein
MTRRHTLLAGLLPALAVLASTLAPSATAVSKPAVTLKPNASVTVKGTLTFMDEGHDWTPAMCSDSEPTNRGQCDTIVVHFPVPKAYPMDMSFLLVGSLKYDMVTPANNIRFCIFGRDPNASSCDLGNNVTPVAQPVVGFVTNPRDGDYTVVLDQRFGLTTNYEITLSWVEVSKLTTLTAKRVGTGISVKLIDSTGKAVAKAPLVFTVKGKKVGTATTDAKGNATLKNAPAGPVVVSFAGIKDKYASSSATVK